SRSESELQESVSLQRHIVSIVGAGLSALSQGNLGQNTTAKKIQSAKTKPAEKSTGLSAV
ncbi:hypothetical protein ACC687_40120, partial [Rhizobium ruizarguesonis]